MEKLIFKFSINGETSGCVTREVRNPTIGFRPTDQIQEYIDSQLKKDSTKSKAEIIRELCEQAISYSGQEGKSPSQIPTGIVLECELRRTPVRIASWSKSVVYPRQFVDSSICKTCPKYPCEEWKWIFTEKRLNPDNPSIKQIEAAHGVLS